MQNYGKAFIRMSAFGNMDDALEAMKIGSFDYISKTFQTDLGASDLKKAEGNAERLKRKH